MKILAKKIVALILAVGLCFALCSCDMGGLGSSDVQGYYKDEAKTEIVFDNNTYKLLDVKIDDEISVSTYNAGNVIEEGTPDILAFFLSDVMWYNDQKTIIEIVDDEVNSTYYCRTDVYDEISQITENLELDYLCYTTFDDENNPDDHALEGDIVTAVNEIVSTQTPKQEEVSSEKYVSIYKCDKTMTFQQAYVDVDLLDTGKYVITSYNDDFDTFVYEIPSEKLDMFKTLVDTYGTEVSLW